MRVVTIPFERSVVRLGRMVHAMAPRFPLLYRMLLAGAGSAGERIR
jgi:hypothetical protein